MTPRVGSLFTGYGGLDLAVEAFFAARTVWTSDIDPGACKIIAHRFPDALNIGDVSEVDWTDPDVEPIEILTGGFPCQDVSTAGKRAGLKPGTRSGLWSHMAYAIDQLRPQIVVAENVRGLLSARAHSDVEPCPWCVGGSGHDEPDLRALGAVLGDLADLGYDAQWVGLRAADIGAPHGRFRVFVVATDTRGSGRDGRARQLRQGRRVESQDGGHVVANSDEKGLQGVGPGRCEPSESEPVSSGDSAPDAGCERHGRGEDARSLGLLDGSAAGETRQREREREVAGDRSTEAAPDPTGDQGPQGSEPTGRRDVPHGSTAADPTGVGRDERRAQPAGLVGGSDVAVSGHAIAHADSDGQQGVGWLEPLGRDPDRRCGAHVSWGDYEPAIRRWERVLGHPAPAPTETGPKGGQRLAPRFVEWMMGLPAGWVTDVPDLSRNAQLKALGNGVVPQQAYEALRRAL